MTETEGNEAEQGEAGETPEQNDSAPEAGDGSAAESAAPESATATISAVDEWKNRAVYLAAEIENMRKRFARERADLIRMANEELLKRLLPVVDNLEFAVKAAKDAEKSVEDAIREHPVFSNLLKGIDMTLKHFEQTLEQIGVQAMNAAGKPFDPSQHEAIGQAQEAGVEEGHVAGELQRGFTLHGRVLRPAKVLVNKK